MLTLSSIDIKNQEFKRSLRGLDEAEVSAFLDSVATQWQEQQDDMRRLEQRAEELESKIKHYQRIEEALQQAISSTKATAAAALDDAKRRSKLIVEEAKLLGRKLTNEAVTENGRLIANSARLSGKQAEITARLRAFLNSELELLDHYERTNPTTKEAAQSAQDKEDSRMAPVALAAVDMHDQTIRSANPKPEYYSAKSSGEQNADDRQQYSDEPAYEAEYDNDADSPDSYADEDYQESSSDGESDLTDAADVGQHVGGYAMERQPQPRSHEPVPSIGRTADAVARTESNRKGARLESWPSDTEEVMNPNASQSDAWESAGAEPGGVFADDDDPSSIEGDHSYNINDEELEKIRRILDNLD